MISRLSVRHILVSKRDGKARKAAREQYLEQKRRFHRIKIRRNAKPTKFEHPSVLDSNGPILVGNIVQTFEDMLGHHGKVAQRRAGYDFRKHLAVDSKDKYRSNFEIVFQHWPDELDRHGKDKRKPLVWKGDR